MKVTDAESGSAARNTGMQDKRFNHCRIHSPRRGDLGERR